MSAQEIYDYYHQRSEVLSISQEMVKQFRETAQKENKLDWPDYCYFPLSHWEKLVNFVLKTEGDDCSTLAILFLSLTHWNVTKKVIKGVEYKDAIKDESLDSMDLQFLFKAVGLGAYVDFTGIEEYFSYQLFEGSVQGAFVSMNYMDEPVLIVEYFSTKSPGNIPFIPYPMAMEVNGQTVGDSPAGWDVIEIKEASQRLKRILARYALDTIGETNF